MIEKIKDTEVPSLALLKQKINEIIDTINDDNISRNIVLMELSHQDLADEEWQLIYEYAKQYF